MGWVSLLCGGWPKIVSKAHVIFQSPHGEAHECIITQTLALYHSEKEMQKRSSSSHKTERKREAKFFGEILSSFDQAIRSTFICGPIELKFGRRVHNSRLYILDGGDQIWSILQLVFGP